MIALDQVRPGESDVRTASDALTAMQNYLAHHPGGRPVRLVVDDEQGHDVLVLPRGAVELLARILDHMAAGKGVSVVPLQAELTTQQAADMLNVSRPFLIGLLDAGDIDYRKVGKHRRIRAESLLDYMRADDQRRQDAADELVELTQQMGLA